MKFLKRSVSIEPRIQPTGFTGEGGMVMQVMSRKSQISVSPHRVPEFDIEEVSSAVADDDYVLAVQLARGFQAEAPRANATIAIARSVLKQKNARAPTP